MEQDTFVRAGRLGAISSAPLGIISVGLAIAAEVSGTMQTMASPLGVAASITSIAATTALLLALVWAHLQTRVAMAGRGGAAMALAVAGAGLTIGAAWSLVPAAAFDARFPGLLTEPLPAVLAGYILSHTVLGVGVLLWAVAARRAGAIPRGVGTLLIVAGLICIAPLPARYVVVSIGIALLARRWSVQQVPAPVVA